MRYEFYHEDDDKLLKQCELPDEGGIAVAVRSTGFDVKSDEALQLAIVDFSGAVIFSKTVKPQNVVEWQGGDASGGITPADVAEAPELYQFEDEIMEIYDGASCVVTLSDAFARAIIEASWVALPDYEAMDLTELFCQSHSAADYPDAPAAAASLAGIAEYFDVPAGFGSLEDEARVLAACYLKQVQEFKDQRDALGEEHWEDYRRRKEAEELSDVKLQNKRRAEKLKAARVNAFLWLGAAAVFANLAVQLYIRGFNFGFTSLAIVATLYFVFRWIKQLVDINKLRNGRQ